MWSSVLDAYADDEDQADGENSSSCSFAAGETLHADSLSSTASKAADLDGAGSVFHTSAASAATAPALSQFPSPPQKKRIDVLRLQMCCPTIVGVAVEEAAASSSSRPDNSKPRVHANSLFSFSLPRDPPPAAVEKGAAGKANAGSIILHSWPPTGDPTSSSSCGDSNPFLRRSNTSSGNNRVKLEKKKEDDFLFSAAHPTILSPGGALAAVSAARHCIAETAAADQPVSQNRMAAGARPVERVSTTTAGLAETPPVTTVGVDGIPVLQYKLGVFHVAEEAPVKQLRVKSERMQLLQHQPAAAGDGGAAVAAGTAGPRRGKALLSLLPKPQHQHQQLLLAPTLQRIHQRTDGSSSSSRNDGGPSASGATDGDTSNDPCSSCKDTRSSVSRPASNNRSSLEHSGNRCGSSSSCSSNQTGDCDAEDKEQKEADGDEGMRGPLFSLFSAYDDEQECGTASNAAAMTKKEGTTDEIREQKELTGEGKEKKERVVVKGERRATTAGDEGGDTASAAASLPFLNLLAVDMNGEATPWSVTKSCNISRSRVEDEQATAGIGTEPLYAASAAAEAEETLTGSYIDVWGGGEAAAPAGYSTAAARDAAAALGPWVSTAAAGQQHRCKIEGMSLNEYRELQNARVKTVSGESLRDPDWQMNYHVRATPAQAKRTKLNISTNVWSVKDKGVVQTGEPRPMQKRKHQINWLAADAAEKELEMWEMMAKTRQNKHSTAMKYGW